MKQRNAFHRHIIVFAAFLVILNQCSDQTNSPRPQKSEIQESWSSHDNPSSAGIALIKNFDNLPTSGESKIKAWSAHYWPSKYSGIYKRYQRTKYSHTIMESDEIRGLSQTSINRLSPAEKFDLLLGRYSLPLSQVERAKRYGSPDGFIPKMQKSWRGICNGWSLAAINEPEPGIQAVLRNPYGVEITFYQDDIKALLSRAYNKVADNQIKMIGRRCSGMTSMSNTDMDGRVKNSACRDSNPGTFHILLANIVGRNGDTFIIDRDPGYQVWNQPISGYSMTYGPLMRLSSSSFRADKRAAGTAYLVDIDLKLEYVTEHVGAKIYPRKRVTKTMDISYSLELDYNHNIIGGEWKSKYYPDFVWLSNAKPANSYEIPYSKVQMILNESLRQSPPSEYQHLYRSEK